MVILSLLFSVFHLTHTMQKHDCFKRMRRILFLRKNSRIFEHFIFVFDARNNCEVVKMPAAMSYKRTYIGPYFVIIMQWNVYWTCFGDQTILSERLSLVYIIISWWVWCVHGPCGVVGHACMPSSRRLIRCLRLLTLTLTLSYRSVSRVITCNQPCNHRYHHHRRHCSDSPDCRWYHTTRRHFTSIGLSLDTVVFWCRYTGAFISHIASQLISSDLISFELSPLLSDQVRRGCDQSDKTPRSDWSQPRGLGRFTSSQRTRFRCDELSSMNSPYVFVKRVACGCMLTVWVIISRTHTHTHTHGSHWSSVCIYAVSFGRRTPHVVDWCPLALISLLVMLTWWK